MKEGLNNLKPEVVKIYSNNDEILKKIGQILSSEKSRKIYGMLIETELNAKEVAKLIDNEENPRLPNIIFHLDKMVNAGMLTMSTKQQRRNGHYLKYYKAVPTVLVVPPKYLDKAQKSKTLYKMFENIFKLSALGVTIGGMLLITELGFFFEKRKLISKYSEYISSMIR